jgi:hypothetical protein
VTKSQKENKENIKTEKEKNKERETQRNTNKRREKDRTDSFDELMLIVQCCQ